MPALPAGRVSAPATAAIDNDTAVLSSAITAHIESVVNDARRNVGDFNRGR